MTEMEKSKIGLPHIFDDEAMHKYKQARALMREFNQTDESEEQKRVEILERLLKRAGKNLLIIPDFLCQYGDNISVGDNVVINTHCMLMDNAEIVIGDDVLIGPNVSLYTVNHALYAEERVQGLCIAKPIIIGNRAWLCGDVTITAGVTIGEDSVIGAGSVVTKDIPSGVIAAGNPCRVIRKIGENDKLYKDS